MKISNSLNHAMRVSSSGLAAERFRMDVISQNIANANSTKVNGKDPYRRQDVVLQGGSDGVRIASLVKDQTPFREVNDPSHPNAVNGKVTYSNVDPLVEMVNMIGASRSYEANVAAFNSTNSMIRSALQIGKI